MFSTCHLKKRKNPIEYKKQILNKIQNNKEVVGIVGLGYVGLPLAVSFAEVGVHVVGFDKS